ncbi:cytochrome P450 [Xylaria flabelliformis]|nr:cytochrome P450 [Xylaria flabelliformis]
MIIYRIYFHPLAKFPGPKLAAATELYEVYFDLIEGPGGQFANHLKKLHRIYGSIVRINPNELHVEDSAWFSTLYVNSASGIRDKYPPAANMIGTPGGVFGAVSHETHQKRRGAIGPCFSKSAVAASESMIYDHVDKLIQYIENQISLDGSVELRLAYSAFSTDTLMEHCFGQSMRLNLIENHDTAIEWSRITKVVVGLANIGKRIGWVIPYAMKCPMWMLAMLSPDVARVIKLRHVSSFSVREYSNTKGDRVAIAESSCINERKTLFRNILSSKGLPDADKSPELMAQQAFEVVVAGIETTGRSLAAATYYVLSKPEPVLLRLREELENAAAGPNSRIPLKLLENLPWLTAIIKEALRVGGASTARMPRISPHSPLLYKNWIIPPGTAVSMTVRDLLMDSEVFDAPLEFRPERWLPTNPNLQQLNRNWQPFSRGNRMCVGMNLAMANLYITIASIFRHCNIELHDTIWARDIQIVRDCFIGEPSKDSTGVRVKRVHTKTN